MGWPQGVGAGVTALMLGGLLAACDPAPPSPPGPRTPVTSSTPARSSPPTVASSTVTDGPPPPPPAGTCRGPAVSSSPLLSGCLDTPFSWSVTNNEPTVVVLTAFSTVGVAARASEYGFTRLVPPDVEETALISGVPTGFVLLPEETVTLLWTTRTPGEISAIARPDLSSSFTVLKELRGTLLEKVGLPSSWSSRAKDCVTGGIAAYDAAMKGKLFAENTWNSAVDAAATASACYSLLPKDTRAAMRSAAKTQAGKLFAPLKQFGFVVTHLRV